MNLHFLSIKASVGSDGYVLESDGQIELGPIVGKTAYETFLNLQAAFKQALSEGKIADTETLSIEMPDGHFKELGCTLN